MEQRRLNPASSIIHGVQGIILIEGSDKKMKDNPLSQDFLIIQDRNDRGLGTGISKLGLPGGGINYGERPINAIKRELYEEVAISLESISLVEGGCFQKKRANGLSNDNYLFSARLPHKPICRTNDDKEVSKVCIVSLWDIIVMMKSNRFHEGSMRLIFHFLNGTKSGSLNDLVSFKRFMF